MSTSTGLLAGVSPDIRGEQSLLEEPVKVTVIRKDGRIEELRITEEGPENLEAKVEGEKKCEECRQNPVKSPKSKYCVSCYKERRKKQLQNNNAIWKKRLAVGIAGHHATYGGKLTQWAQDKPEAAMRQVKKMKKVAVPSVQELAAKAEKLLKKKL